MKALQARLQAHLTYIEERLPGMWAHLTQMHLNKGEKLGLTWPDWCFTPTELALQVLDLMAGQWPALYGYNQNTYQAMLSHLPRVITALAAWRIGKQVYRFDPDVQEALSHTSIKGDLPGALLTRLPAWGVYLQGRDDTHLFPQQLGTDYPVRGVWAYLDWTLEEERESDRQPVLQLVLDLENPEAALPITLSLNGTLEDAVRGFLRKDMDAGRTRQSVNALNEVIEPLLSMLLYLCSQQPDYGDRTPRTVTPRNVRKSAHPQRIEPDVYEVGIRLGSQFRKARAAPSPATTPPASGENRAAPEPYMVGFHWQTYWTGPKDAEQGQVPLVRWKLPYFVGVNLEDAGDLPIAVRPVQA